MSRNGKIAHLPANIRAELNRRLDDGHEATVLADWLNSLPEVQAILRSRFDGIPISKMNICRWREGGFVDWQRNTAQRESIHQLAEEAADLTAELSGESLARSLATVLAAELVLATRSIINDAANPEDRFKRLLAVLPVITRLSGDDHHATRVAIARERADLHRAREEAKLAQEAKSAAVTAVAQQSLVANLLAEQDPSLQALGAAMQAALLATKNPGKQTATTPQPAAGNAPVTPE
jgi:hypothetical protein